MSLVALFLLAVALSADAFAVALAWGASGRVKSRKAALRMGAVFGATEMAMPLLGFFLATQFADVVRNTDHWLAFALLGAVGGHMLWEGLRPKADDVPTPPPSRRRSRLAKLTTALGTSIDAAAVGVALAFVDVNIWLAVALIGAVCAALTTTALLIGPRLGSYLGRWAEVGGGLVLLGIGSGILYTHTLGGGY
jgi:putative Mn2+ efflux pump MntP